MPTLAVGMRGTLAVGMRGTLAVGMRGTPLIRHAPARVGNEFS
ncbi:hypothetical protein Pan216_45710 [Planctomycetes bacterium Pan216]|uniref:Uncharacterized protein n=1 Tax=Kolteria novifilia TaxID=2527975 RepID=A0A518B9M5_9BACT|nr:hypothetical protein Pan216_45710 [Planctomycetes bacterium Pan216]